jgi:FMN phosphatase YigB (HAD superfamily)
MNQRLAQVEWLFLDPTVMVNENETDREVRRQIATALGRRGQPVLQEQVERAWMQTIAATRPIPPLVGAIQMLAPGPSVAAAVVDEVTRSARNLDTLQPGTQLALNALQRRFKVGIISPYRLGASRKRLVRFHLSFPVEALSDELKLSHQVGSSGKTDPALFVWALRKAGVVASHAAFATDRVDLGVAPAKAAGLVTIWLRVTNHKLRHPRNSLETPDLTLNSLGELAKQ